MLYRLGSRTFLCGLKLSLRILIIREQVVSSVWAFLMVSIDGRSSTSNTLCRGTMIDEGIGRSG